MTTLGRRSRIPGVTPTRSAQAIRPIIQRASSQGWWCCVRLTGSSSSQAGPYCSVWPTLKIVLLAPSVEASLPSVGAFLFQRRRAAALLFAPLAGYSAFFVALSVVACFAALFAQRRILF